MAITSTIIAPGRRYVQLRGRPGAVAGRITIMHVGRDARGVERVTFRSPLLPADHCTRAGAAA